MSDVYAEQPLFEVAVDQLELTRSQDFARVFVPGGDREIARTLQSILAQGQDVATSLSALETTLVGLYDRDLASIVAAS